MSKLLLSIIVTLSLLTTISIQATKPNPENRQELQAIKMEKAKLQTQERLLRLKQTLNLQKQQLPAWSAYEKYMQASTNKQMFKAVDLRKQYYKTGIPPTSIDLAKANIDRLDKKLGLAKERLVIFSALYQELNDEQRATIDKMSLRKVKKAAKEVRKKRNKKDRKR
ncbi:MAG: hypothetical protein GY829_09630 [Gammaproteobacteria bacterium]|nr:hypothetical protein [Gammaproteobacteria bacterium]